MKGLHLGYIRVSTVDQNEVRQLQGIYVDKVFTDKVSGRSLQRPELKAMLDFAREGDRIIVHSIDRLARSLEDAYSFVKDVTKRGICVEFIKERLVFTGDDSPISKLMFGILGSCAEFERALILERQREGIAIAKQEGVYKGRRKALTTEEVRCLRQRVQEGKEKKADIARSYKIHPRSLYNYLEEVSSK